MNNRLTYINHKKGGIFDCERELPAFAKLGQYEDIDEDLGIEYKTIYKCATQGFYEKISKTYYTETCYNLTFAHYVDFKNKKLVRISYNDWDETYSKKEYLFEDYGTKWALTQEELK